MYFIYKITNLINAKTYIGLTTRSVEKRWKEHIAAAFNPNLSDAEYLLHKAIYKYGINNFSTTTIDTAETEDELKQKEIYYISYYHSFMKEYGYNMTHGGDLNSHLLGELSPVSKNEDVQRWEVIRLLQETTLTFLQIAQTVGLNGKNPEKIVDMINRGENFYQSSLNYPIRTNAKSISKRGANNPAAKPEKIKKVIELLINTNYSQKKIAELCEVHYNTVNDINRCVRWTEYHNYKQNIRKESRGDK